MTAKPEWLDLSAPPPTEAGWYAAFVFYDHDEGSIAGASYWTGAEWDGPVVRWLPERLETQDEAWEWFWKNDPDSPAGPHRGQGGPRR